MHIFYSAFFLVSYSNFSIFLLVPACVHVFSVISIVSYNFGILKKLGMIFL